MALTVRQLTNSGSPLYSPSGVLLANVSVTFTLVDKIGNPVDAFDVTTGERITGTVAAVTDQFGVFSVNLWPNDRGDKATAYLCKCPNTSNFSAQVPSGVGALSWLLFKTGGQILTPSEVTQLDIHIADANAHLTPEQNSLMDYIQANLVQADFTNIIGTTSPVQEQIDAILGSNVFSVAGKTGFVTLDSSDVGLGNVDNTSDLNKPISTATQSALDLKSFAHNPQFTGNFRIQFSSTENFLIDARTYPRQITLGVFRVEHTSGIEGTRPFTLDIDCNGFGNTHALVIDYKANGLTQSENHLLQANIDTADSGVNTAIQALSVSKTGTGSAMVYAVESLPGVHLLKQVTGEPLFFTQAWKVTLGVYADVTDPFLNGTNISIFQNDNDSIVVGYDTQFRQIEVQLQTKSSHTIDAIFEYSTGVGTWQAFGPSDGTNGFTENGFITWPDTLTNWVSALVNGVSKYYIRITRTKNLVTTVPVESNIRLATTVDFGWDSNAKISVKNINAIAIPVYADRTAAIAGGLIVGDVYQTSAGLLMIV